MRRRLRIDRLVIADGLIRERDVEALRQSLQVELGRVLDGEALNRVADRAQRAIPSLAASVSVPPGDAGGLARGIAMTIRGALR
jgi:hypothetical protein